MDFSFRKYKIAAFIILVCLIFIGRFFYIQIIDESYQLDAENNSRRYVVKHPARGLIYDRNGKLIVANEAAYDLMVVVGQVKHLDTIALLDILQIPKKRFLKEYSLAKKNRYRPHPVVRQISAKTYINLQENLHHFPGFYVQVRAVRQYPDSAGAIVLGYVSEVTDAKVKSDPYYKSGDYVGRTGIERMYEQHLRGVKGGSYYQVDVKGRVKGRLQDGEYDQPSVLGKDITTTLDIDLQKYGEQLMSGKTGSIVAIDPSTGEVLSLISAPYFDPNLLVGQSLRKYYGELLLDPLKPLFNRALQGDAYPPGSTFKIMNGLIALEEGIITPETRFGCNMGYTSGGLHVGCHSHENPLDLEHSIMMSCNAYYCATFRATVDAPKFKGIEQGYESWRNHVLSFGFDEKLGIDLPYERPGRIPSNAYYDNKYKGWRWKSLTVVSLAIGQGEISMTPLQLANYGCAIANRGYYYTPHIVKALEGDTINPKFKIKHQTTISPKYFDPIVEGMYKVVQGGPGATARHVSIPGIEMCGKTGTAQNPHGKDHSIFLAFAPKDNPKIVVAVYVENSGYGGTWAAPIASLMIEKYLRDTISDKNKPLEKKMLEADLIHDAE